MWLCRGCPQCTVDSFHVFNCHPPFFLDTVWAFL